MYDKFDAHRYRAYGSEYINDRIQADCSAEQFGHICGMPIFIGDRVNIGSYMKLISDAFFRNCRSASNGYVDPGQAFIDGNLLFHRTVLSHMRKLRLR